MMRRFQVGIAASADGSTGYPIMKDHPEGEWLSRTDVLGLMSEIGRLQTENNQLHSEVTSAAARINDLEGQEVKLIETSGQCFRVASRFQREAGDTRIDVADWLEGRLKRLAELEEYGSPGDVCPIFKLAQRFRDRDHGPAGESLEQWLEDKLQRAAALDHPIAPASQMAYVPWRSAIRSDVYGPYSKPPISLIPQRLVSAERAISNLEEITDQLLTSGDGVDVRLDMLDEDVERGKERARKIEMDVSEHERAIQSLIRRVCALETRLGGLEARVVERESRSLAHGAAIGNLVQPPTLEDYARESQSKHQP